MTGRACYPWVEWVAWKGLIAAGDSWEPLSVMFKDVPSKVREFFKRRRLNPTLRRARTPSASSRPSWDWLRYLTTGRPRGRSYRALHMPASTELAAKPGIS